MYAFNAVLVCDRSYNRDSVNIWSTDLEYTSTKYYEHLYESLTKLCPHVFVYTDLGEFERNISKHKVDVVFSAIWSGVKSRNRKSLVAAICEAQGIRYVGADAYAQIICQDKYLSQLYCKQFEIEVPNSVLIRDELAIRSIRCLKFPVIIKPVSEGGSMGISDRNICYSPEDVVEKYNILKKHYLPLLVEEYIQGEEIAACIIGTAANILHYEFVRLEIDGKKYFNNEVWGFESKKGGKAKITRDLVTNSISSENQRKILDLYKSLGKIDYMRIDCRLNQDGKFYLIELTPDCSLHPDCFMFESFHSRGYSYVDMIDTLLKTVKDNYGSFKSISQ